MTEEKKFHDTEIEGSIHIPNNFKYANLIARKAATNFEAEDLNKLTLQLDNGSYWRLVQITPVIKWKFVAGPNETLEDEIIYIDDATGNDTTGDGSISYPYKSFDILEKYSDMSIKHDIRIKPKAGNYNSFPSHFSPKYEDGRIIIDASNETYPVISGPYTIDFLDPVGDIGPYGVRLATKIIITPDPSWSNDQFYGKFIHVLTGNWAGYILPIFYNRSNSIHTYPDWYSFAPGDTFNIIDCPVSIDVNHSIFLSGSALKSSYALSEAEPKSPANPCFLMAGIKIRSDSGELGPIQIQNLNCIFSFCSFIDGWNVDSDSVVLEIDNVAINTRDIPVDTFDNEKLTDWYTYPLCILSMDGAPPIVNGKDVYLSRSELGLFICRRQIYDEAYGTSFIWFALCGGLKTSISDSKILMDTIYISQINYSAIPIDCHAHIFIDSVYIDDCVNLFMDDKAYIRSNWLKGSISSPYALKIRGGSYFGKSDETTISGLTNDVYFERTSDVQSWPTGINAINDSGGSWVVSEGR